MKKSVKFMLLAAALVLSLTACGGKDDTAQDQTEAVAAEEIEMGSITRLGQYIGVKLTKQSTEVSDEEVDEMIRSILEANPDYVEVDRAAGDGDRVNIDYVGIMDGEEFDGGSDEDYYLTLGSGAFIDGFEDGLVGAKAGEKRSLELTFPEEYYEELAGQDVVFNVTVNSVEEIVVPELDDEFVQGISEFSTVDEFREELYNEIKDYKTQSAEIALQRDALRAVLDTSSFDINQEYLDQNLQYNMEYAEYMASMYGMELGDFLSYGYGMTYQEFEDYCAEMIEEQMEQSMMVDDIAERENLQLTDEDLQYAADKLYEDLDDLKENDPEYLEANAITFKVARFIIDKADITEEVPAETVQDEADSGDEEPDAAEETEADTATEDGNGEETAVEDKPGVEEETEADAGEESAE